MTAHTTPPAAGAPLAVRDEIRTETMWVGIGNAPLPIEAATRWAVTPQCGAAVTFTGMVRETSEGHTGVACIDYEVYAAAVTPRLVEIAEHTFEQWPMLGRVALLHRCGRVQLGDSSVVVVASSPHRREAFQAAEFCIDVLKRTVPIWKLEHSSTESQWIETGVLIEDVAEAARQWHLDRASTGHRPNSGIPW